MAACAPNNSTWRPSCAWPTSSPRPRRPRGLPEVLQPMSDSPYLIDVSVTTRYLPDQSRPDEDRYAFAYTITIRNLGTLGAQLISRHWIIT
ncbi:ApaG domain-containing protein, partial [Escherichia coli]|uniref:ApaG domain-containing protein n=1 Tax=Escherichia coli TaxID=562 RepID=UPI003F757C9E